MIRITFMPQKKKKKKAQSKYDCALDSNLDFWTRNLEFWTSYQTSYSFNASDLGG